MQSFLYSFYIPDWYLRNLLSPISEQTYCKIVDILVRVDMIIAELGIDFVYFIDCEASHQKVLFWRPRLAANWTDDRGRPTLNLVPYSIYDFPSGEKIATAHIDHSLLSSLIFDFILIEAKALDFPKFCLPLHEFDLSSR